MFVLLFALFQLFLLLPLRPALGHAAAVGPDGTLATAVDAAAKPSLHEEQFTQDWTSSYVDTWKAVFSLFFDADTPHLHFLEVGCFEGRSTIWMLENVLRHETSRITCIDKWSDDYWHSGMESTYEVFIANVRRFGSKVIIARGKSSDMLRNPAIIGQKYDFIYVDGLHEPKNIVEDAVMAWPMLRVGGVMAFDDYLLGPQRSSLYPKTGVDAFLSAYNGTYALIVKGTQVFIQKVRDEWV